MLYSRSLLLTILTISFGAAASAQVASLQETMAPQRGIVPFGTYALDKIEAINTESGSLNLTIPIATLPRGRAGFTPGLSLIYNSEIYDVLYTSGSGNPSDVTTLGFSATGGGWNYGYDYSLAWENMDASGVYGACGTGLSGPLYYKLSLITPDGSHHTLLNASYPITQYPGFYATSYQGQSACWNETPTGINATYYTADGSYLRLAMHSDGSWILDFPDGKQVTGQGLHATTIADANGNQVTIGHSVSCASVIFCMAPGTGPTTTLTDFLSRAISITHPVTGGSAPYDQVTYPASDGTTLMAQVNLESIPVFGYYDQGNGNGSMGFGVYNDLVISSLQLPKVTLPGGGSYTPTYSFQYNAAPSGGKGWGELSNMQLPSGATVAYHYLLDGGLDRGTFGINPNITENPILTKTVTYPNSWISTPYTETWHYDYHEADATCTSVPSGIFYCGTVVTDPQGGTTEYDYIPNWVGAPLVPNANAGLVYRTVYPDLSSDEIEWGHNAAPNEGYFNPVNPYAALKVHTIPAGSGNAELSAVQSFTEDANGNTTGEVAYDWTNYSNITHVNGVVTGFSGSPTILKISASSYETGSNAYSSSSTSRHWNLLFNSYSIGAGNGTGVTYGYDNQTQGNPTSEVRFDSTKSGGSPSSFTASQGVITYRGFDGYGNLTSVTDPVGNVTSYTLDSNTLYVTAINQAGLRHFTVNHTPTGLLSGVIDTDNCPTSSTCAQTSYGYDPEGRVTSIVEGTGSNTGPVSSAVRETQYLYNDETLVITTKTDLQNPGDGLLVRTDTFDELGRLLQTQRNDPCSAGTVTQRHDYGYSGGYRYEQESNPYCSTSDPTMGWTQTVYDTMSRPLCVITYGQASDPSPASWPCSATGTTGVTQYDYSSNTTTVTDQAGVSRTSIVDGMGRMTSVLENGIGASTAYGYDVQNNLTSVLQGSQTRSFSYTSLGRLSSATNPESGTTGYTYYDNGNLHVKTDARAITSTMTYDGLNRVLSKTYSDGTPSVSYTYDANEAITGATAANYPAGRLAQVSTTSGGTAYVNDYQYDPVGRATASMQSVGSASYPFLYTYWPAGMRTETYPSSARVVTNTFDSAGRVSQVADGSITYASSVAYAPQGAVSSVTMGSITETTQFNTRLQPTQIQAGSLLTLAYGYGTTANNGNVQSQTMSRSGGSSWAQNYTYDGANRLQDAGETGPGTAWYESFGYDGYGNQWLSGYTGLWTGAVTNETPQSSSWYSGANQITNGGTWTYDSAGNITAVGGMSRSFTYDAESRQTQAVVNSVTESYVYDGEGRRVVKSSSLGTSTYLYDADGQLAEELAGLVTTGTEYLTADMLGSTRLVTGTSGTECEDYLPFGEQIQGGTDGRTDSCFSVADVVPEKKFTGKERDAESGLDYFGARYFSSVEGRWTSPDPRIISDQRVKDPQQWNAYAYTRGNPLQFVDPDGREIRLAPGSDASEIIPVLAHAYAKKDFRPMFDQLSKSKNVLYIENGDIPQDAAPLVTSGQNKPVGADPEKTISSTNPMGANNITLDNNLVFGPWMTSNAQDFTVGHEFSHAVEIDKDPVAAIIRHGDPIQKKLQEDAADKVGNKVAAEKPSIVIEKATQAVEKALGCSTDSSGKMKCK